MIIIAQKEGDFSAVVEGLDASSRLPQQKVEEDTKQKVEEDVEMGETAQHMLSQEMTVCFMNPLNVMAVKPLGIMSPITLMESIQVSTWNILVFPLSKK